MDLFIITGTNRGLGFAIADKALKDGHAVISLARQNAFSHPHHFYIQMDLANLDLIEFSWDNFFKKFLYDSYKNIHLIQNSAQLNPVGLIENLSSHDIKNHIAVNFTSAVILTKLFLSTFRDQKNYRVITNVGSGASTYPIAGWGLYCATKSALAMFTNVCEKDHKNSDHLLKIINFNPGVMDTSMQEFIRSLDEASFPRVNEFIALKDNNQLKTTDNVAKYLLEQLYEPSKILTNSLSA